MEAHWGDSDCWQEGTGVGLSAAVEHYFDRDTVLPATPESQLLRKDAGPHLPCHMHNLNL